VAAVELKGLSKHYGEAVAVAGVSLRVEHGQLVCLLGPSGCGKTTTLRLIAGFIEPSAGEIVVGGKVLSSPSRTVPPEGRSMSMIFQSYALWPHMTVAENVAYGLKIRKLDRATIESKLKAILSTARLEALAERYPGELSGGQQQRVSLARALAHRPRLLLLDEPLSNLDAKLRDTMRNELRSLQQRLGITALYVTHDQSEALSMSDRVAVMNQGRIVQEAAPRDLYYQPADRFVADFVGRVNMIPAVVRGRAADGDALVEAFGTRLVTPCPDGVGTGADVTVTFRPESVRWHEVAPDRPNLLPARVVRVEFLGEIVEYEAEILSGQTVVGSIVGRGAPLNSPETGDSIFIELTPQACRVLAA